MLIPTDAPYIDSISIIGNRFENELVFKAKDAVLKGDAKVVEEDDGIPLDYGSYHSQSHCQIVTLPTFGV